MKTMPVTGTAFLLSAFSVMGLPPFGGFFSKYMVITGAVAGGHIYIAFTFLLGAILTLIYLLRLFVLVFMGEARIAATEGSFTMVSGVAALAVLSLLGGLFINFIAGPLQLTVKQMLG